MRAVVQRVSNASVLVNNKIIGAIDKGYLVFLGVGIDDEDRDFDYIYRKIVGLRVFTDENDKMNLSISEVDGQILLISQFTLYGDVRGGNRPSFTGAAKPGIATHYYEKMITQLSQLNIKVQSGEFGAHMDVALTNDGPVTILLDSKRTF